MFPTNKLERLSPKKYFQASSKLKAKLVQLTGNLLSNIRLGR